MQTKIFYSVILMAVSFFASGQSANTPLQVKTVNGIVEGTEGEGIRSFKGLPYAQPPIGDLRWKEPQPVINWTGLRKTDHFGPRAMQRPVFSDMVFRSDGVSEDCLYLNVWTPAKKTSEGLPVLVYFYGGGFVGGDGSELRYDGESMAKRGIVAVTVNYRLGVFGFMAHPELTAESAHHASGNYGLMDQNAALRWVKANIAAFGGDPKNVTIAGESAGSYSVSAQITSPLSKGLFAAAIGESGSLLGNNSTIPLADGEQYGLKFMASVGASSLADMRKLPADVLLQATAKPAGSHFSVTVDGYFFPESPREIYKAGKQAHVPLLAGWNSTEQSYHTLLGKLEPTLENYSTTVKQLYGDKAADILKLYNATTPAEVQQAATDLASDRFISFSTWRWIDMHQKTSGKPVYWYIFNKPRPEAVGASDDAKAARWTAGAMHSWEIEYALGNLPTNKVYAWTAEDYQVSATMQSYFANFIKTHNPNGDSLPQWDKLNPGKPVLMWIDVQSKQQEAQHQDRYRFLDGL